MMSEESRNEITAEVLSAAKANANGWVYKIEGGYGPDDTVPPEAIVGAWKVDASGNLTGEFVTNPKYVNGHSKSLK